MTAVRVIVVGSANMDLVGVADHLPRAGETVLGHRFVTVAGGKGANQAIAAARAGATAAIIASVGDDAFGKALREALRRGGVDIDRVRLAPGPSGVALIAVDRTGENQILVAPGANALLNALTSADVDAIANADALICQLETPVTALVQAAQAARDRGVAVVVNAAPARTLPSELLDATDLLVVNRREAQALAAVPGADVDDLLKALVAIVPRVAITLGAEGVAYADREGERLHVRSPEVAAVDTTAAGDAFVGALTVAWTERRPMSFALEWACAAGAASTQKFGAADSLPPRSVIDDLHATFFGGEPG